MKTRKCCKCNKVIKSENLPNAWAVTIPSGYLCNECKKQKVIKKALKDVISDFNAFFEKKG